MTKKQENLTYLVLFFFSFTLLVYLIVDAATADRGQEIEIGIPNRPPDQDQAITAAGDGLKVFQTRDLLFPLVTPIPTPTRVIVPTPTPTPVPFMVKWKVITVLPGMAMFSDETGKPQRAKLGEVHNDVKIIALDVKEQSLTGEYVKDGQGRTNKIMKGQGL